MKQDATFPPRLLRLLLLLPFSCSPSGVDHRRPAVSVLLRQRARPDSAEIIFIRSAHGFGEGILNYPNCSQIGDTLHLQRWGSISRLRHSLKDPSWYGREAVLAHLKQCFCILCDLFSLISYVIYIHILIFQRLKFQFCRCYFNLVVLKLKLSNHILELHCWQF